MQRHPAGWIQMAKKKAELKTVETVDIAPTWAGLMPWMLNVLYWEKEKAKAGLRSEIQRMARILGEDATPLLKAVENKSKTQKAWDTRKAAEATLIQWAKAVDALKVQR